MAPGVQATSLARNGFFRYALAMKIVEMRTTFTDQWIAAKVLKVDKTNVPLTGEVIFHSFEKATVYQAAKTYLMQHPTARLFIFFTGDPIPEGVEAMLAFC